MKKLAIIIAFLLSFLPGRAQFFYDLQKSTPGPAAVFPFANPDSTWYSFLHKQNHNYYMTVDTFFAWLTREGFGAGATVDTNSLSNRINLKVDTIYRTAGKDSIQFTIGGRYHAVKDSTGSGLTAADTAAMLAPYLHESDTASMLSPYLLESALSASETDPVFDAWLTAIPNISEFNNDVGYLTSAPNLAAVLTAGNDGAGFSIQNVEYLYDAGPQKSINIFLRELNDASEIVSMSWKDRKLYNSSSSLVGDWESALWYDLSGDVAIDAANRMLKRSGGTPMFDFENLAFPQLGGSGNVFVTCDNSGNIASVAQSAYQTSDADLSTIAGLTATTDNFLVSVSSAWASRTPSQVRTTLGLVVGTNVQAFDADLTTYAGITPSSDVQTMLGSANNSAIRSNIGLAIGTNVQAFDADLTTYAGITPSANVQTMLGSANNAAIRSNIGSTTIGDNIFTLTNPSALGYIRANADNTVTHRTYANVKTDLSLNNVENTALSTWAGTSSITTLGTITSGTLSTGAVIGGVTMTLGSDATGNMYYRNSSGVLTKITAGNQNTILQMGASSVPAWSTPTFPTSASTSGKVMMSDGTNFITSTPTFPNTAGTSGKVVMSDGTNFITSTPTFPNAATTIGQPIRGDGTNFVGEWGNGSGSITGATGSIANSETKIFSSDAAMAANRLIAGSTVTIKLAGTASGGASPGAPIFRVRYGTAATTSDGQILSFTLGTAPTSGTNVAWSADIVFTVRTTGGSATCDGTLTLVNQGITGLSTTATQVIRGSASTFNTTTASTFFTVTFISGSTNESANIQDAVMTITYK